MMIISILQLCFLTVTGFQQKPVNGLYNVTLVVFSGRPDPEWTVASSSISIENVRSYDPSKMPPRLGYKGILVNSGTEQVRLLVGPETMKIQLELMRTMPKDLLAPDFVKEIISEINSGEVKPVTSSVSGAKRAAPPYAPGDWLTTRLRLCNNCYNYANNRPTYNYAQPGFNKAGPPPGLTFAQRIAYRARRDNLTDVPAANLDPNGVPVQPNDNKHVVALVVRPDGQDFHWYRMDNRLNAHGVALWSHKPGQTPVIDYDSAVPPQPITDPSTANHGPYVFVGYMYSNPHVNIAGPLVCNYL